MIWPGKKRRLGRLAQGARNRNHNSRKLIEFWSQESKPIDLEGAATPPRDNHGYLHRVVTQHARGPEMSGEAWITGARYQIAGWVTRSKRGRKYLELRFTVVPK
jgi:hypothetical protein